MRVGPWLEQRHNGLRVAIFSALHSSVVLPRKALRGHSSKGVRVGPRSEQLNYVGQAVPRVRQAVQYGRKHHLETVLQSFQDNNVQLLADAAEASKANYDESSRK